MTTLTKRIAGLALVVALAVLGAAGPMQAQTTTDRIAGLSGFVAYKAPVKAATTGSIALSGEQTIDGVSVTAGDRVLVKDQTDATENGIYVVATGAWTRATDFNGARDIVSGTQVLVRSGSINAARSYRVTTADDITIGASSIAFDVVDATSLRTFGTRSDITSTPVGSSITHLRTAGYASIGDGGGATYQRANSEPTHNLKVQSADGAWWELVPDPMGISVRQAGAKGDDVTDDSQAFIDAINGVEDFDDGGTDKATHRVIVPAGRYYMGDTTLQLKRIVHLLGASSGMDNRPNPAKLRWDAQTTGIIVHNTSTIGATTESTPTGGANGSIIEGLELKSGGGTIANVTDGTQGHGIWLRARAELRNLSVYDFPGHGVQIVAAQGGSGGVPEGNANAWRLNNVRAAGNHLNGVYVNGADTNAGHGADIDANNNGRWGIEDASFLGNTWTGCHASANGGNGAGENSSAGTSAVADFGGSSYLLNVDATEADAVATQPGTDRSVWIEDAGLTGGVTWTAGLPEGTFHHGGSYKSTGSNARTVFLGCYIEPGKGAQFKLPTLWIGGHETADTHGNHGGFAPDVNKTLMRGSYELARKDSQWPIEPDRDATLQLNWNHSSMINLLADGDTGDGLELAAWLENTGSWAFAHGSTNALKFSTTLTSTTYGRASAIGPGLPSFENGFFLGQFSNARHMWNDTAAPTTGEHARGEIYWNRDQSDGGILGWVCVTSGSPGTWVPIRGVGTQTSGAAQAALTDNTGGTTDDTLEAVSGSGADAAINNNFAELAELVDEMRSTLVGFGFMTGGP